MLPSSRMTCKVIFVCAHVTADVASEWMFVAMATHVNGVEDIVRKVNFTVLAFLQKVLVWCGQHRGGCARLAVANTRSKCVHAVLTAEARLRTAAPVV